MARICPLVRLSDLDVTLVGQPLDNLRNALLDGIFMRFDGNLWVGGLLVGGGNACEVLDLSGTSLLVEALGVALLGNGEGHVDKDFDKGDRLVIALAGLGMQLAGKIAVCAVWRYEGSDGNGGGVGEELCDLLWGEKDTAVSEVGTWGEHAPGGEVISLWQRTNLGDATNVLIAVFLRESQILVEAKADIVAVETVRSDAEVKEMLLESRGDSGLSRGREPGEPKGEAALATELVALAAGEGRVPGDVSIGG